MMTKQPPPDTVRRAGVLFAESRGAGQEPARSGEDFAGEAGQSERG